MLDVPRMRSGFAQRTQLAPYIFGRPFVKRFALCYRTVVCPVSLSVLSVTLVYCGQTVRWIRMPLGIEVGLGLGDFVFDVDPAPQRKGHSPNQFLAHVYSCQTVGWMKTPLGTEVDRGPGHIVLDGDPAPPRKGHRPPLFCPCQLWPRSPTSATAELLLRYSSGQTNRQTR